MRTRRQPPSGHRRIDDTAADQLARRAAGGDQRAFSTLCEGLLDDIWRYCWSLTGDRHLADEATQETFARATTAISRYRGDAPVRLWFVVLARRSVGHAIEHHRRAPEPATPEHLPHADRTAAVELTELIEALTPEMREPLILTQVLGFSYADAAAALDVPIGTIRSRVFRARATLVESWTDADTDITAREVAE